MTDDIDVAARYTCDTEKGTTIVFEKWNVARGIKRRGTKPLGEGDGCLDALEKIKSEIHRYIDECFDNFKELAMRDKFEAESSRTTASQEGKEKEEEVKRNAS